MGTKGRKNVKKAKKQVRILEGTKGRTKEEISVSPKKERKEKKGGRRF